MLRKKSYIAQGILLVSAIALNCSSAQAGPIDNTWTIIANDEGMAEGPGAGGQAFDAEYFFYKKEGTRISIGLQAGFNVQSGLVEYGTNKNPYYAGDLALSFDGNTTGANGSGYEYAFDFGLYTADYWDLKNDSTPEMADAIGGNSGVEGVDFAGLYEVSEWNNDIFYDSKSSPFAMESGDLVDNSYGTTFGVFDNDSTYWRIVSFDLKDTGINIVSLDAHWTMSCGNDNINGTAPVPEPATMLLFGTGLMGLVGMHQRKKKKQA